MMENMRTLFFVASWFFHNFLSSHIFSCVCMYICRYTTYTNVWCVWIWKNKFCSFSKNPPRSLTLLLSTCERASFSYSWFIIIYRLDFSSSSFILISHHWVILGFSLHEIYFRDFFNRQRMIMIAREVNYRIKKLF